MAIRRGCGTRVAGGVYAVSQTSPYGHPQEEFWNDLGLRFPADVGLTHIGTRVVGRFIFDWVGSADYPNALDVLMEAEFTDESTGHPAGFSRRLSSATPWDQISRQSLLVLIHSRGYIQNPEPYMTDRLDPNSCPGVVGWRHCDREIPPGTEGHNQREYTGWCARLWRQDVERGGVELAEPRAVIRYLPGGSYQAYRRPEGVIPVYQPSIIARFPIALEVVRHPSGSHESLVERIMAKTDVPIRIVTE